ncbi:ADP-ribose glycohydrolase MACROD2 isoform X13 [Chrysemys picta bellii]|uniref:ADP-ribose glycohydrolase MACROD2 isoform X13 n=1 Tax=Chrysemys picta bellii TaxID=8478 RepID=UPI0032B2063B
MENGMHVCTHISKNSSYNTERLLKMTLEDRRKEYLREHVPLKDIPTWMEEMKSKNQSDDENTKEALQVKKSLSEKVSLYRGDITLLEIDAIVNAANSSLLGGGGVDGCIHRAAGPCLVAECRNLCGCETGQAKITCGYDLPAKYVIHTVGPIARGHISDTHKEDLASCYKSSLKLAKENNIRSIAFPCISTGIYGFPNEPAAVIALTTIKEWLNKNHNEMDRVIFCVFLEVDYKIFKKKMSEYFPTDDDNEEETEINEDTEGLEQKAQSPSPMKCKAKKSENLKDDNEDSSKDSKATQENDPAHHAMCEEDQDEGKGPQDVSTIDEMKTQTDSQSSCMETEEPLANKEDAIKVEKPMTPIVDENKEESKEEERGEAQGKGKLSAEAMTVENPCDTENISSNDAEMNSQVESINEHSEMQPED